MDTIPEARRTASPAGTMYRVPSRPPPAHEVADPLVPIASMAVNGEEYTGSDMTDGRLSTSWRTLRNQVAGDRIVIAFDHPVAISSIEMDLGGFKDDYPRKLRVSVADGGQDPTTVWEGSTTGLAMLAALKEPSRMPLTIDLPSTVRGRQLILAVVGGHPGFAWSIAELMVRGR